MYIIAVIIAVLSFSSGLASSTVADSDPVPDGDATRDPIKICLDPGHPSIPGDKLFEGIINRKVVFYLRNLLEGDGYDVLLTTSDLTEQDLFDSNFDNEGDQEQSTLEPLSLEARADICNTWQADYLISIHHNFSFRNKSTNYVVVLYGQRNWFAPRHKDAPLWAGITARQLLRTMRVNGKRIRGDQDALGFSLTLLKEAKMMGILVEASFYSNRRERVRLNRNTYLEKEARAVFKAFKKFLKKSGRQ